MTVRKVILSHAQSTVRTRHDPEYRQRRAYLYREAPGTFTNTPIQDMLRALGLRPPVARRSVPPILGGRSGGLEIEVNRHCVLQSSLSTSTRSCDFAAKRRNDDDIPRPFGQLPLCPVSYSTIMAAT